MKKILISPSRYVQGFGELENLGGYVEELGKKALLISHQEDYNRVKAGIEKAFSMTEMIYGGFSGECSKKEIERLENVLKEAGSDVVIGLGGGKSLDTAKAVAMKAGLPVIVVPTIASTDAPCSSLAVIYTENGEFEEYMFFKNNPNLVLVDTDIIAKAPVRFLVAGIGDALATKFEARACERANANNIPGGKSTKMAVAAANACYDILLEDGLKAKLACESNVVTQSLENIVEANILLSGLGFESSGLAGAHAIHDGLTVIEETHRFFHGEKVAFGVLVQLVLENAKKAEIEEVMSFCKLLGLPTCLKDLGVNEINHEKLMEAAKMACDPADTMGNMPFTVTPYDVYSAILTADKLGSRK
ncbi:glycerol dehydrogenase [Sebaldella sp. S0638]|uniref:glycerol dehydrogenase n=1 Tax=Sebaldella sp. S0638 TaxID=2957809 RepID=UPI0020A042EE|nr:glycerol dehydrogenase [Sebaldella sp. S0638]MCP1225962.1 glycerol dehydrogenase [Sebaldella sp. S0638]